MKYGYGWVLKFILAAILLGVGIYMVLADEVVYLVTGVVILIFSVFRVIPLLKTLNKEVLRTLNLIEIIFDTIIGGVLVYVAATGQMDSSTLWKEVYRFALAFFFYARGLVYFNSVVFLGEKTEVPKFWIHILSLSIGTYIAISPDFSYETVGLFLLVMSLIGSAYLGYDGFGGYKKYRQFQLELNQGKEKGKAIEKQKEVILDEQKEDRPYVN